MFGRVKRLEEYKPNVKKGSLWVVELWTIFLSSFLFIVVSWILYNVTFIVRKKISFYIKINWLNRLALRNNLNAPE